MQGAPVPRFRTKARKITNLADVCYFAGTSWLLGSLRFVQTLAEIQPEGLDVLPAELQLGDGTLIPSGYYVMVDVTYCIPAYDLSKTKLTIGIRESGTRHYLPEYPGERIILREDIPRSAHVFRDEIDRIRVWMSVDACHALRAARINGIQFAWPDRNLNRIIKIDRDTKPMTRGSRQ